MNSDEKKDGLPSWLANFEAIHLRLLRLEKECIHLMRLIAETERKVSALADQRPRG